MLGFSRFAPISFYKFIDDMGPYWFAEIQTTKVLTPYYVH